VLPIPYFLFQQYLYQQMDAGERAYLHEDVGRALETLYDADAGEIATSLAMHFEQAGIVDKAVVYLVLAAEQATRLSAKQEAIGYFRRGLALAEDLPDSRARAELELRLRMALGIPLLASRGYADAEVGQTFDRARELCTELGNESELFPAMWGVWSFYLVRGELRVAYPLARQLFQQARIPSADPEYQLAAHWALACSGVHIGRSVPARRHLLTVLGAYSPERHHGLAFRYGTDPGVACHVWLAWVLWFLGYPDQARTASEEAVRLAETVDHPLSQAFALTIGGWVHQFPRDDDFARERRAAGKEFARTHGLPFFEAISGVLLGGGPRRTGGLDEGIDELHAALGTLRAIGAGLPITNVLR
jgi:predicted ATPase